LGKSGRGTEIFGLRDFRDGDNPRHRIFKRILPDGRELVKEFEQEGTRAVSVVVFDIYDDKLVGKDDLERTLEKAASVCVRLITQGVQVGVKAVSGTVKLPPANGDSQLWQILDLFSALQFLKMPSREVEKALDGEAVSMDSEATIVLAHPRFGLISI
jgi:uncharacterized protein (DUF58 family)